MIRRKRRRRSGMSKFAVGLIGIVVLVVFTYGGFTKFANPFASKFTVHAIVPSAAACSRIRSYGSPG